MYMIVGLGNPGIKYEKSRHNVGFLAVDALALKKSICFDKIEHHGCTGHFYAHGEKVIVVKPQTYMNNSGICVREMADYYRVPMENILVFYDDIDLELGQIRIRGKGGAGTHNGMKSVIAELGDNRFPRMRFGIGPQPEFWDLADFVLSAMNDAQMEKVQIMCDQAVTCVDLFVNNGIDIAMNRLNVRPKKKKIILDSSEKSITESNELYLNVQQEISDAN